MAHLLGIRYGSVMEMLRLITLDMEGLTAHEDAVAHSNGYSVSQ